MTKLQHLYGDYGQSPWLDNLTRASLRDGTLARMVANGIRGVTANPTIFARSISGSHDYDEQFSALIGGRQVGGRGLLGAGHLRRQPGARRTAAGVRRRVTASTDSCRWRCLPSSLTTLRRRSPPRGGCAGGSTNPICS